MITPLKKSLHLQPLVDKKFKRNQSKVFYLPVKLGSILQILSFMYSKADPITGLVILAKPSVSLVSAQVQGRRED